MVGRNGQVERGWVKGKGQVERMVVKGGEKGGEGEGNSKAKI